MRTCEQTVSASFLGHSQQCNKWPERAAQRVGWESRSVEKGARALLFLPKGKRCAHRDIHCSLFTECGSGDRSNAQEPGRGQTPGATLRTVTELYCTPKGQAHSPPSSAPSQLFSACTFTPSLISHALAECPPASRAPKDLLVPSLVLQNPLGSQAQGWGSTGGEFWSCSRRHGQGCFLTAI